MNPSNFNYSNGKIIMKLRSTAKIRLKRYLKTLDKLKSNDIIDKEYVMLRKKSFYAHIKNSNESRKFKEILQK